jgi:hypothetical protein
MILIISSKEDAHLPFVTCHLDEESYVIIDAYEVINKNTLTFSIVNSAFKVFYMGRELNNITGVWVRRPSLPASMDLPVNERYEPYVRSALKFHLKQLFTSFPDAIWMSDDYTIGRASTKTLQLRLASEIQFNIPDTIFTSDSNHARGFVHQRGQVIVKPQATTFPQNESGKDQAFFATKVSQADDTDFHGIDLAPVIVQELIATDFDIRVTVVGEKLYATKITLNDVHENLVQRDWRLGYIEGSLTMESFVLPDDIANKCIALTMSLGLTFGAIDLVQDYNEKIWFLEINPNGQWAFVEEETKQPIGKEIALLLSGVK